MSDLTVTVGAIRTGHVVTLTGPLDVHTTDHLRDTLAALTLLAGEQLILDLTAVTTCDSSGLTALVAARNRALATGATIALVGVPAPITRTFHHVGLGQVFPTHPTLAAATRPLHRSSGPQDRGPNP